jgi:predicted permease
MNDLMQLFLNNLLPIFLIVGTGYALKRFVEIDPKNLSQLVFYVLIPALVFVLIISTTIKVATMVRMMTSAALIIGILISLSWLIGRILPISRQEASAFILVTAFMNAGNFGLSLNQLAFGEQGLAYASLFYITSSLMNNSLGVWIAQMEGSSFKQSLLHLSRVPAIYSIFAALLLRSLDLSIPQPLWKSVNLLGAAAVPSMLLLLGMQIGSARAPHRWGLLGMAILLRLMISPLIAMIVTPWLGLQGVALQAATLEAATPTAVLNGVLALKFDVEPDFVAACILVSTLLSPLSITPLLAFLT